MAFKSRIVGLYQGLLCSSGGLDCRPVTCVRTTRAFLVHGFKLWRLKMSHKTGECCRCERPSKLECPNCRSVSYCGEHHQEKDWPNHRLNCNVSANYEVVHTDELGYHVIATKDINANEIIVSELPLALGPHHRLRQRAFCVGCYVQNSHFETPTDTLKRCPGCNWLVCHENCPGLMDPRRHSEECQILKEDTGDDSVNLKWSELLPSRCMLVQNHNPKKWKIMKQMGLRALWERDPRFFSFPANYESEKSVGAVMMKLSDHVPDSSVETVAAIFALIDLYGINLTLATEQYLYGIYPTASLFQQNCLPNTYLFFEEISTTCCQESAPSLGLVTARALRNIRRGEVITTIRTIGEALPLLSTWKRQGEYLSVRGLRCTCDRCLDPTELNLHTGTIRCGTCSGWILPIEPQQILDTAWKCYGPCGSTSTAEQVRNFISYLENAVAEFENTGITSDEQLLELLESLRIFLHPKHRLCVNVTGAVATLFSLQSLRTVIMESGTYLSYVKTFSGTELTQRKDLLQSAVSFLQVIGPVTVLACNMLITCITQLTIIDAELMRRRYTLNI